MKAEVRFRDRWMIERAVEHCGAPRARRQRERRDRWVPRSWAYPTAFAAPQPVDVEILSPPAPSRGGAARAAIERLHHRGGYVASSRRRPEVPPLLQLARMYHHVRGRGRRRAHRPALGARARAVRAIHAHARAGRDAVAAAALSDHAASRAGRGRSVRGASGAVHEARIRDRGVRRAHADREQRADAASALRRASDACARRSMR